MQKHNFNVGDTVNTYVLGTAAPSVHGHSRWHVTCNACGQDDIVRGSALLANKRCSCLGSATAGVAMANNHTQAIATLAANQQAMLGSIQSIAEALARIAPGAAPAPAAAAAAAAPAPTPAPTNAPPRIKADDVWVRGGSIPLTDGTWMRGALDRKARRAENETLLRAMLELPVEDQTPEALAELRARGIIYSDFLPHAEPGTIGVENPLVTKIVTKTRYWGMTPAQIEERTCQSEIMRDSKGY